MRIAARPKVIIRRCPEYDVERIRTLAREALEELDLRPFGRTLVKPNCVASGEQFPHAYTRPEFLEGVLAALKDRAQTEGDRAMTELAVGERCGITLPTRMSFQGAGYYPMFKRAGVKHYHFEEVPQVEIPYSHPERLRDYVFTPEPIARADFFVNCPKFKSHPWTTVTFSMKNYIGIQDDRHRLIDHDHRLNEKIADLQYIIQPQFIAIDGVIAGEGRMLTPIPRKLGLVIFGNVQTAFDAVCCNIIGVDPFTVDHLRLAHERGFGPLDLNEIEITGDVTLEEAQKMARGFQVGLIRVEKYFEGTHISAYAGPPPETEHTDYCWGGCPGSIEEAIEILRLVDSECDAKMPRLHIVFGAYAGDIPAGPGERVIFVGDCATWKGELSGKPISVESLYRDRSQKDPHTATEEGAYTKMWKIPRELRKGKDEPYTRITGCPVSVSELVLAMIELGKTKNPFFIPKNAWDFNRGYIGSLTAIAAKRLAGKPYQIPGPTEHRGEAAPIIERKKTGS